MVGVSRKFASFLGRDDAEIRTRVKDYREIGELVHHSMNAYLLDEEFGETLMYYGELFGLEWPKTADMILNNGFSARI